MSVVPAICDQCGSIFSITLPFGGMASATMVGNRAGPCPTCGGIGHIPDGVYDFVGRTIQLIQRSAQSAADLRRLQAALQLAQSHSADRDQIASTLRREAPELASLADALPKTRSELYAFLSLIVAAIALLLSARESKTETSIEVHQVLNYVMQPPAAPGTLQGQPQAPLPATAAAPNAGPTAGTRKVGRNDACPCGSGKKYKKCHLVRP